MISPPELDLPLPHAAHKLIAAKGAAVRLLALHQLSLHHHLGGDAGMIGSGLPQHVAPAHALEADEHVLQRVVERVPHMQRAGHVGRRNDDGEGTGAFTIRAAGGKCPLLLPEAVGRALDRGRLIGLVKHRRLGSRERKGGPRVLRFRLPRCQQEQSRRSCPGSCPGQAPAGIQFLLFALCALDTGFGRYDRVLAVAPLRVEILKLLAKRRGEHAGHVLVEPLLEQRAEHLLDAVL